MRDTTSRVLLPWEIDALIAWFMFRMGQADRAQLMADLPSVYNRVCGATIVKVERVKEAAE